MFQTDFTVINLRSGYNQGSLKCKQVASNLGAPDEIG